MKNPNLKIRNMRREELDTLVGWSKVEGWNPGLSDADIFWETEPEAFIAAELDGEFVGGGSIASYNGQFGYMGFFIMRADLRNEGLGSILWHERLKRLIHRLHKPATIGMDGVFDMQHYYAKGGFEFAERDLRFEATGHAAPLHSSVVKLDQLVFEDILAYDRRHFPAERSRFLDLWIKQAGASAFGAVVEGKLSGFGVMRPCHTGYKIGPLFADNPDIAENLLMALIAQAPGESIFLDVPESNRPAIAMVQQLDMVEVFGCAKMYFGPKPDLPGDEIFGVTSFEFG